MQITGALAAGAFAADEAKPADPATPATRQGIESVFKPTDLEALKSALGKKFIVEGAIIAAGANRNESIRYLNFTANYRDSVTLVFHVTLGGSAFTKQKIAEFVGKKVRAHGVVTEHNGAFQIEIRDLSQIKVQP